jgi:hypothetical protein
MVDDAAFRKLDKKVTLLAEAVVELGKAVQELANTGPGTDVSTLVSEAVRKASGVKNTY